MPFGAFSDFTAASRSLGYTAQSLTDTKFISTSFRGARVPIVIKLQNLFIGSERRPHDKKGKLISLIKQSDFLAVGSLQRPILLKWSLLTHPVQLIEVRPDQREKLVTVCSLEHVIQPTHLTDEGHLRQGVPGPRLLLMNHDFPASVRVSHHGRLGHGETLSASGVNQSFGK